MRPPAEIELSSDSADSPQGHLGKAVWAWVVAFAQWGSMHEVSCVFRASILAKLISNLLSSQGVSSAQVVP